MKLFLIVLALLGLCFLSGPALAGCPCAGDCHQVAAYPVVALASPCPAAQFSPGDAIQQIPVVPCGWPWSKPVVTPPACSPAACAPPACGPALREAADGARRHPMLRVLRGTARVATAPVRLIFHRR